MELAEAAGMKVSEPNLTRYDLFNADECFLTGTGAEIMPVVKIDGRVIGTGKPGKLTRKLVEEYHALTNVPASRYTSRIMQCSICKEKPATVLLTHIENDKMQKLDLCEDCAKTKGVNDPTTFSLADADLLLGLGAAQELEQSAGGVELKCPRCGFSQADFKKSGRLGCPECYQTFSPKVWRDCSRRCTRARGTPARRRKRCASRATRRTG